MTGSDEIVRKLIDENACLRKRIQELEQAANSQNQAHDANTCSVEVAERKRAEEALTESEAKFRAIVDSLPLAIYLATGIEQVTEYMNPAMVRLFGYTREDIPSIAEWLPLAYPDESYRQQVFEEWTRRVRRAIETQSAIEPMEVVCTCKDGSKKYISWGFVTIGEKNYACGLDLTERKNAEKALRESEAQKNAILNGITTNIALVDTKLNILWANKAAAQSVQKLPEEMVGRPCFSFWGDSLKPCAHCPTLKALQTKRSEHIIVHSPNGKVWDEGGEPVFDDQGNVIAVVEIAQDITDRKLAEAALAEEKERLAVTLRSIGDGVITTDVLGRVVIMNRVAEELTGWSQSEAQGQPLATVFCIVDNVTRQPCENPAEKVLASDGIIELANHTLLMSRDGHERIIADSGAPIRDRNSVTIGVVLVFRDMTEKQKLLDALQRSDKLDSLGVLAGGIAHDFNNMLAGIFGYVDLACRISTEKEVALYLENAMGVFGRAKDLTQQLLTFSKGGAPKRITAELGPLIRDSASFALSGSTVACDYQISPDLWLADFDRNQIGQVIDNLVLNAQQAMPLGGRIIISAKNAAIRDGEHPPLKAGRFIQVSVVDTGVGIPPDLLKRIFDPFFTTKQKGNGLGLATCYAIVQKHEGAIEVESVMGKGSTFHVFLPASQGTVMQGVPQVPVTHTGRGKMLIMDDEECIRDVLGIILQRMGYTVLVAKDGAEALALCDDAARKGAALDGAFFDLTVPGGMGGKEAIVQLRRHFPDMPVYASSGYSEDPVMANPAEYGFTDSICKPYRQEELVTMLNRHARKESA